MHNLKQFTLSLLVSMFSLAVFGQVDEGPIYASVENETYTIPILTPTTTETIKAPYEISVHLLQDLDFPFGVLEYQNQLTVMVEVQIDDSGKILRHYVHDTDNQSLKMTIKRSLQKLGSVSPVLLNGKATAKSIMIPVTFKN